MSGLTGEVRNEAPRTPSSGDQQVPVSILILTKNEEADLPGCLASVDWSSDVVVLDSCSDDRTAEVAREHGARVVTRKFDGYASQRNFGLHEIPFTHEWVLLLDADERIPQQLVSEIQQFVATAGFEVAAGQIRRRDFWESTWLKHAQISPFFVRLVRHARVHYEREINEVLVADGETQALSGYFDHFPFSKGLDHWIEKHNSYSRMEARLIAEQQSPTPSLWQALWSRSFTERRRHQKALFYRMPCRPILKFCYMMVARRAFLDGLPGIRYAILQTMYEYWITLKARELAQQRSETEPSPATSTRPR